MASRFSHAFRFQSFTHSNISHNTLPSSRFFATACAATLSQKAPTSIDAHSSLIPHPSKAKTGGEDACFVNTSTFGVFDGVGGWASQAIDSGEFSRSLATHTA